MLKVVGSDGVEALAPALCILRRAMSAMARGPAPSTIAVRAATTSPLPSHGSWAVHQRWLAAADCVDALTGGSQGHRGGHQRCHVRG